MLKDGSIHLILIRMMKERPLPIGKNKKVIGLFKFELSGKIMTEFVAQRAKAYTYSMEDGSEIKKLKGQKNV